MKNYKMIMITGLVALFVCVSWMSRTYAIDVMGLFLIDSFDEAKEKKEVEVVFKEELISLGRTIQKFPDFLPDKHKQKSLEHLPKAIGEPFKTYVFENDEVRNYNPERTLPFKDYLWEVPVFDKAGNIISITTARNYTGKWEISTSGMLMSEEMIKLSVDTNAVTALVKDQGLGQPKDIKHVTIPVAFMDAIYFNLKSGEEYLIPLNHRGCLDLQDLKAYKVQDVMKEINSKIFIHFDNEGEPKYF